jgi:aminoglycoside phosphotransferase (APT) family kinase protein
MAEDVAAALAAWLTEAGEPATVTLTGRATVGLSQDTFFVTVTRAGDEPVDAVLRLPTPASGPRAIRTQRAALQAVTGHLPAPTLLWHDDGDANPFGRPFLTMERIVGTVPAGWHELPPAERAPLAEAAVDALAQLHRLGPDTLDAGPPPPDRAPTELGFYLRRLERFAPLPPVLHAALWWLQRHAPTPRRTALVHGDFRMGNMIVADGGLAAILDWEMAAPGDPLADLVWCFLPVWEPAGVDEPALVARYAQATGTTIDPDALRWHRVLAYVRLAYYALSASHAFARGDSDDLRLAALAAMVPVHLDRLAATLAGEPIT